MSVGSGTGPRELRPRVIPPFVFQGPFTNGQPSGSGIILSTPSVLAGATAVITHNLGRVPVWVIVLQNGTPDYPGEAYITTATSTQATVKFERAQTTAGFIFLT